MYGRKRCDSCEKRSVGLSFGKYNDFENFMEHGELPGLISLTFNLFRVSGGEAFYLWPLGLTVVLCDECLAGDKNATLFRLLDKPRLLQEAFEKLNLAVIEREIDLIIKKGDLLNFMKEVADEQTALTAGRQARADLLKKINDIRSQRQRLAVVLQKIVDHDSAI